MFEAPGGQVCTFGFSGCCVKPRRLGRSRGRTVGGKGVPGAPNQHPHVKPHNTHHTTTTQHQHNNTHQHTNTPHITHHTQHHTQQSQTRYKLGLAKVGLAKLGHDRIDDDQIRGKWTPSFLSNESTVSRNA